MDGGDGGRQNFPWVSVGIGAALVLAMWLTWFYLPGFWNESGPGSGASSRAYYELLVGGLAALIAFFGWYVWTRAHTAQPLMIVTALLLLAAGLIIVFASAYFQFGYPPNFSTAPSVRHLSHLDALSLAVGTLTTAGSVVTPRSQWARGLVMTQQLVDFAFIGFIASIAIGRLRQPVSERPSVDS
jgi:hypothetical protein